MFRHFSSPAFVSFDLGQQIMRFFLAFFLVWMDICTPFLQKIKYPLACFAKRVVLDDVCGK